MKKRLLSAAVIVFAAASSGRAVARTTAPAGADAQTVGEIVVTAQRRSEALQNVPMSITALTGAQLEASGVITTQGLQLVTPGLNWARSTTVSQPTIRGVGSRNASAGDEPNVATYIDGVYQPEQSATLMELSNIERVEVLKGPQGTLYGRNATGGAINVITKRPSLDDWTGDAKLTGGDFHYRKASTYLSGPLIKDKLALGLAAVGFKDHGYVHNVYLDSTQGAYEGASIRVKLLYQPTDRVELQLNGLYVWSRDSSALSGQPRNGNTNAKNATLAQNPNHIPLDILAPSGRWTTATGIVPTFSLNQYILDGHMSVDLGWATLSGLISYGTTRGVYNSQSDGSPLLLGTTYFPQRAQANNQELVLTSNGKSRLTWLVGAQRFESKSFYTPVATTSLWPTGVRSPFAFYYGQNTRAYALFAEATYELVDNLYLTGGLRYSRDRKTSYNQTPPTTGPVVTASTAFDNTSPRAVLRYEFSPRSNVYASFTKGFKSGTYNAVSRIGALTPAQPEKITAYEVGVKTTPIPQVTINAAAYHYVYRNLQTEVILTIPGTSALQTLVENAPEAKIDGFDLDATYRPIEDLRFTVGMSVMNPRITDFKNSSALLPRTAVPPGSTASATTCAVGVQPPCGNYASPTPVNVTGNQLIRAPRFTLNVAVSYQVPLEWGTLAFDANAYFSDKYFFDLTNRLSQPPHKVINASVSFTTIDKHWTLRAFGQNLTNQYYTLSLLRSTSLDNAAYNKPRWFGGSIEYRF
jgi:iron complex outermembrane receptor protein